MPAPTSEHWSLSLAQPLCSTPWPAPQVRRFNKFRLGEGLEKKSSDFAAEVAQQTQAKADKPAAAPKAEKPKEEAKPEEPKKVGGWGLKMRLRTRWIVGAHGGVRACG